MGTIFRFPQWRGFFLGKQRTLFWLSGQTILAVFDKKRKKYSFSSETGFEEGVIADGDKAQETLSRLCQENTVTLGQIFSSNKVTVFLPTGISPLEQSIVQTVFQKVGFSSVELRRYVTAFRAFLAKQNEEKGVFVYMGQATSEVGIFSASHQRSLQIPFSLQDIHENIIRFFRERHFFEISHDVSAQLYQELGKQHRKFSLVVRGRNTQNGEIETRTLTFADVKILFENLQHTLSKEITSVMNDPLFREVHPEKWTVLGDSCFQHCIQEMTGAKVLLLQSEFDLMQGIEWL